MSVDTTWQDTDIGTVLISAKVGNCQLIYEDGPPPKPYKHEGKGGLAGELIRSGVGTTLDTETFTIPLEGTDPIAKHHRQSRKMLDQLMQASPQQPVEFEALILKSYSGEISRDDLIDYTHYRLDKAQARGDQTAINYWKKMQTLVVGPIEDVIIQAKIKSLPLGKLKEYAKQQASSTGTEGDTSVAKSWSEIESLVDEPLPDRYAAERQRFLWSQPASTEDIQKQRETIAGLEKRLADLELRLSQLSKIDARTQDEIRGQEPPHPPWSKMYEVEQEIKRIKEDLGVERKLLRDLERKPAPSRY